ncbi:ATP-dependent RNA helicase DHX36-like isoform X2 [Lingula anatina]|uniref:ATP-dependent DNA/RNA helicase DHX36 n=1 Tax=Lingula anatina TaxID=7574 RepID=A0A1S3HVN8_LINAN|nr:ATP-dependent RNA helicase DHX36-like isoform X2 [Lingula anatina]|eukprot:XP_013390107.2 ATP-dependent RNA helicase DHX36-like isoform X2 [Lingula anatina]
MNALRTGLRRVFRFPGRASACFSDTLLDMSGKDSWRGEGYHSHDNSSHGYREEGSWRGRRGGRGGGYRGRGNRNYSSGGYGNRNKKYYKTEDGAISGNREDAQHGHHDNRGGSEYSGRGGGRRGRGGPPAGLRGREIGMWFAQRSKAKAKNSRQEVHLDEGRERHITNLLHRIQSRDNIPPQPSRSYRDPTDITREADQIEDPIGGATSRDYFDDPDAEDIQMKDLESTSWHTDMTEEASNLYGLDQASSSRPASASAPGPSSATSTEPGDDDADDDEVTNLTEVFKHHEETNEFVLEYLQHKKRGDIFSGSVHGALAYERNAAMDSQYRNELAKKEQSTRYIEMQKFRSQLPSYGMRKEIVDVIEKNQVVVISGETGCGKTTQVSQFLLDHYIENNKGSLCRVVCTQPRRISAISVAERVAQERDDPCGSQSVGYSIRLDSKLPRPQGSILFCTTGILLKYLESDPYMSKTSHVILDEIHERDLMSDFLMIILKDLIKRRKDLKVVLMSATLNAEQFSEYFGGCPMIHIPGFTYPVEEVYLEDVIETLRYSPPENTSNKPQRRIYGRRKREMLAQKEEEEWLLNEWIASIRHKYSPDTLQTLRTMDYDKIDVMLIEQLIKYIIKTSDDGAILVFLPGWEDIKKLNEVLTANFMFKTDSFRIIPLHSMMPTVNQRQVFERPPPGVRKIIIATNIAETSITIDDVVFVIDAGKIKLSNFDAQSNVATLLPEWVSKANARQRRGRAGRVQPGKCFHLFTTYQERQLKDYQLPEMLRTRLEELCLQIKLLKLGKIEPFVSKAMQTPSMEALNKAVINLTDMNALDHNEDLTPLGFHLAKLPVDPHIGKMILFGAMFCCLDPILTVAASLSFKDPFVVPLGKEQQADAKKRELSQGSQSDHLMLVYAFRNWERMLDRGGTSSAQKYCWDNFMSPSTLRMIQSMKGQFAQLLYDVKFVGSADPKQPAANLNSYNTNLLKAVICAGLYPNVGRVKQLKMGPKVNTKTERCSIHPKSVNCKERQCQSQWMVYHLKMRSTNVFLYDSTVVSPYPLLFFGGDIGVKKDEDMDCVTVDDWIIFKSSAKTANLVKDLRRELDKLLEEKITRPGLTQWDGNTKEGAIMQAITDLLTKE